MRAKVVGPLAETAAGATAEAVLRACVHCGMCNAVCPTFQLTGDELDGPRGRIYLMKAALEGEAVSRESQLHLDRCLGCRACETACPSGVEYHRLLDIGRPFVDEKVPRPWREQMTRRAIRWMTIRPERFGSAMSLGRVFRRLLTRRLRAKVDVLTPRPPGAATNRPLPPAPSLKGESRVRMSLLGGCVQAAAAPHFNAAAKRVFARAGIGLAEAPRTGCCGAVSFHLDAPDEA